MKHILLNDDEYTFLVFYQPKKKGQLFELLSTGTKEYWKTQEKQRHGLLLHLVLDILMTNGFKCKEMKGTKESFNVYQDFEETGDFYYKDTKINRVGNGFYFHLDSFDCVFDNLGRAIEEIDKEMGE